MELKSSRAFLFFRMLFFFFLNPDLLSTSSPLSSRPPLFLFSCLLLFLSPLSGLRLPPPRPSQAGSLHARRLPEVRTGLGAPRLVPSPQRREQVSEGKGHRQRRQDRRGQVIFFFFLETVRRALRKKNRCVSVVSSSPLSACTKENQFAGDDQILLCSPIL